MLGGQPKLTGEYVPSYPTYLPHANPKTTPFIGLPRASPAAFMNVFCGIESPAPFSAPPAGDNYDTISQLYASLRIGVEDYPGNPFVANPPGSTPTNRHLPRQVRRPGDQGRLQEELRARLDRDRRAGRRGRAGVLAARPRRAVTEPTTSTAGAPMAPTVRSWARRSK